MRRQEAGREGRIWGSERAPASSSAGTTPPPAARSQTRNRARFPGRGQAGGGEEPGEGRAPRAPQNSGRRVEAPASRSHPDSGAPPGLTAPRPRLAQPPEGPPPSPSSHRSLTGHRAGSESGRYPPWCSSPPRRTAALTPASLLWQLLLNLSRSRRPGWTRPEKEGRVRLSKTFPGTEISLFPAVLDFSPYPR